MEKVLQFISYLGSAANAVWNFSLELLRLEKRPGKAVSYVNENANVDLNRNSEELESTLAEFYKLSQDLLRRRRPVRSANRKRYVDTRIDNESLTDSGEVAVSQSNQGVENNQVRSKTDDKLKIINADAENSKTGLQSIQEVVEENSDEILVGNK